jgi:hygromycin-B 4-O-kinase
LLRPVLNIDEVTAFLEEWSGGSVAGVSQFSNGQVSSVFGFEVKGGDRSGKYVVRFVSQENSGGLKKDRFIGPRAAAVSVPVPRLLEHGEVSMAVGNLSDEERLSHSSESFPLAYAICDLMPGEHMDELQDEERRHLVQSAVEVMDKISLIDISDTRGYGWFDGERNGQRASWAEYVAEEEFSREPDGFYNRRRAWFDVGGGFLEASVFEHFPKRMMSILAGLPEVERSVVHIDFGYDNTLVAGSEVSAVLDWDNSIIGEHLYDGARTGLYAPGIDFKKLFIDRYAVTGRGVSR